MATTSLWRIDGWLGHVVVYRRVCGRSYNKRYLDYI